MSKKTIEFIKASEIKAPPRIPTGIFALDVNLGRGANGLNGWAIGRMNVIYGDESGGKTTLVLKCLANAQKLCSKCYLPKERCKCKGGPKKWSILFIDGEGSWTTEWAESLGVESNDIDVYRPESIENMIDIISNEISNRDIIVIETLAAILSSDEIINTEDMMKNIGLKARMLDQAAQKWMSEIFKNDKKVTFIVENQIRKNIGVGNLFYVSQDETENLPGGKWQKFLSTIMVRLYPSKPVIDVPEIESEEGVVMNVKDVVAQKFVFEIKKNKIFIKGAKDTFIMSSLNDPSAKIKVGDIISNISSAAEMAINLGLAAKVGDRKIEYGDKSFPHMGAFCRFLKKEEDEYIKLTDSIINIYESRHSAVFSIEKEERDNGNNTG